MKTITLFLVLAILLPMSLMAQFGITTFQLKVTDPIVVLDELSGLPVATDHLVVGKTYSFSIIPMTRKWVSSKQCVSLLDESKAIFTGAEALSLLRQNAPDSLLEGKRLISYSSKDSTVKVPWISKNINGEFSYGCENFTSCWYTDDCLLIVIPVDTVSDNTPKIAIEPAISTPVFYKDIPVDIDPKFKLGKKDMEKFVKYIQKSFSEVTSIEVLYVEDNNRHWINLDEGIMKITCNSIPTVTKGSMLYNYTESYQYLKKNGFTITRFWLYDNNSGNAGIINNHNVHMIFDTDEFYEVIEQYQKLHSYGVSKIIADYDKPEGSSCVRTYGGKPEVVFKDIDELKTVFKSDIQKALKK